MKPLTGHDTFDPIPYTFRIPERWKKTDESSKLSPPDWLLLDHTIAVVWYLFSSFSSEKVLDTDDLKWAHEYLKEVRNAKGENPPDVKTCLTKIQDRLIAQYAQLRQRENSPSKKSNVSIMDNESIIFVKAARGSNIAAKQIEGKPSATSTTTKKEGKPVRELSMDVSKMQETGRKSRGRESALGKKNITQRHRSNAVTSKSMPTTTKKSELTRKENSNKEDGGTSAENFFKEVFQRNKNNDRILGSYNIARKKTNASSRITLSNEDIDESNLKKNLIQSQPNDGKISLQFKRWITAEEVNSEGEAYQILKNEIRNLAKNPKISKEEVIRFLSDWRDEQMERLQSELKRLNSIEEFMKSFKMEGFVPIVPQDLAQKLELIICKKKLFEQS